MIITNTRSSTNTEYCTTVHCATLGSLANRAAEMSNSRLRKVFARTKVHFFIVCLDYPRFCSHHTDQRKKREGRVH